MSKGKTINELVSELQAENEHLQSLYRIFNSAVRAEFGLDIKAIHKALDATKKPGSAKQGITASERTDG